MPDPELPYECGEKLWHRNSVTMAGLTEDPHADIGPAAGHRKHPAVAGKQVVVEADSCLSPLDRDPLDVGALGDRNVATIGPREPETSGDDRFGAVRADHHPRTEREVPLSAAYADPHETALATDLRSCTALVDGRRGGLGMIQQMSVEFMPRHDVPVGRQTVLLLVVGNIAAIRDLGPDEDPGGRDRKARQAVQCRPALHRFEDSQPARLDEIAADLLSGKGGALDYGHAHAAPGQRPGHDGSCRPTADDDDVVSVTVRHLRSCRVSSLLGSGIADPLPNQVRTLGPFHTFPHLFLIP